MSCPWLILGKEKSCPLLGQDSFCWKAPYEVRWPELWKLLFFPMYHKVSWGRLALLQLGQRFVWVWGLWDGSWDRYTSKIYNFKSSQVSNKNAELSFKDGLDAKVSENKGLTLLCKCVRDILTNQPLISLPISKSCGSESSSPLKNSESWLCPERQLEFAGLV